MILSELIFRIKLFKKECIKELEKCKTLEELEKVRVDWGLTFIKSIKYKKG